ncbi:hypothetical protein AMTRI_Chr10g3560 [Amborella trichopoda]
MLMTCSKNKERGLSNYKFDQERSRNVLANMVVLHEYPFFSIVKHKSFKTFVKNLRPLFKMVNCNTIKNGIFEMYRNEKDKLHEVLQKIPSCICLTIDISSSCRNQYYLCLTCHYIDDAWLLQTRVLSFVYVSYPHTRDTIANVLMDLFL